MKSKVKKAKPFLILIDGPMGSGKTTVAKLLYDSMKNTAHVGVDNIKRFISGFRTNPALSIVSRDVVKAMVHEYLRHRINVIVEQAMDANEIDSFKKIAKKYDTKCLVYQLDAPKKILVDRIHERTKTLNKPKISKIAIDKKYQVHANNKYNKATIFNSSNLDPKEITNLILKDIKNK